MNWHQERRAALRRIVGMAILIRLEAQRLRQVEQRIGCSPATVADAEALVIDLGEETTWAWASQDIAAEVLRAALKHENTAPEEER